MDPEIERLMVEYKVDEDDAVGLAEGKKKMALRGLSLGVVEGCQLVCGARG